MDIFCTFSDSIFSYLAGRQKNPGVATDSDSIVDEIRLHYFYGFEALMEAVATWTFPQILLCLQTSLFKGW